MMTLLLHHQRMREGPQLGRAAEQKHSVLTVGIHSVTAVASRAGRIPECPCFPTLKAGIMGRERELMHQLAHRPPARRASPRHVSPDRTSFLCALVSPRGGELALLHSSSVVAVDGRHYGLGQTFIAVRGAVNGQGLKRGQVKYSRQTRRMLL